MKNSVYLFLFILIFILGCTGKKEETVSFDEITESSKNYQEGEQQELNTEKEIDLYDSLSVLSQLFIDSLHLDHTSIIIKDTNCFPDRFGALETEKWIAKTEHDSLVFFQWKFKDSTRTLNAFYNWLDCYGKKCKSIHVGDEVSFSKRAVLLLLQDQHLIFVESNHKIETEKYVSVFDQLNWNKSWKFIVNQIPRKKAKWFQRDEKEKLTQFK